MKVVFRPSNKPPHRFMPLTRCCPLLPRWKVSIYQSNPLSFLMQLLSAYSTHFGNTFYLINCWLLSSLQLVAEKLLESNGRFFMTLKQFIFPFSVFLQYSYRNICPLFSDLNSWYNIYAQRGAVAGSVRIFSGRVLNRRDNWLQKLHITRVAIVGKWGKLRRIMRDIGGDS